MVRDYRSICVRRNCTNGIDLLLRSVIEADTSLLQIVITPNYGPIIDKNLNHGLAHHIIFFLVAEIEIVFVKIAIF